MAPLSKMVARGSSLPRLLASFYLLMSLTIGLSARTIPAVASPVTNELTLRAFMELVLERNDSVQSRLLEFEINRKKHQAEQGIFEPELVLGYDHVQNKRQNTAEQIRSLGVPIFEERNHIYNGGLESLLPTGARLHLGYTLRALHNNLETDPPLGTIVTNGAAGDYQTFVGLSLTQPLLKNAWSSATLVNIRLAALASEIAYQEYRRQLMIILTTAEAGYWNLYLAQEQVRFFEESVALAEGLVKDVRTRVATGKGADLETLQAEAGLALRRSKLAEARQKRQETAAQLNTLLLLPADASDLELQCTDHPNPTGPLPEFYESVQRALARNPDYLSQQKKLAQNNIQLAYFRNQRLPQLDLKASYGLNGLDDSPQASWDQAASAEYPSYAVGVELRIPLVGGTKAKRESEAARLKKQQVLVEMKAVEVQIINAVKTAIHKVRNARDSVANYRKVVGYTEDQLKTQLTRLDVGKIESRKVLEADADLFEARNAVAEALVQDQRARLELALVEGSVLKLNQLDWSQTELESRTATLFRRSRDSDEQFRLILKELKTKYRPESQAQPQN